MERLSDAMNFRDRQEYKDWRAAVLRLFGRRCLLCGHPSNLHSHHVKPVNIYPELAFEPMNGAPLCGNCHTAVKDNELAYVEKLQQRQQQVLGHATEKVDAITEELKCQAEQNPGNVDCVRRWFENTTDSGRVMLFFDEHRHALEMTPELALVLITHCISLGTDSEVLSILTTAICKFPDHFDLRIRMCEVIYNRGIRGGPSSGQVCTFQEHALHALSISPNDPRALYWAAVATLYEAQESSNSQGFADRLLATATTNDDRIRAFLCIADIYCRDANDDEANRYYRQVLTIDPDSKAIDEHGPWVLQQLANLLKRRQGWDAACGMARRCLALEPDNKWARNFLSQD